MQNQKNTIWVVSHQNLLFPLNELLQERGIILKYSNSIEPIQKGEALPDLIISDIARGVSDSLLNLNNLDLPFLIVSECQDLETLQRAFEFGAMDYIIHPCSNSELIAKVEFALKKINLRINKLVVTPKIENLTQKETLLFNLFFNNLDKDLSRETIVAEIWGGLVIYKKSLDVHLHHLRKKLKSYNYVIHYGENNKWKMSKAYEQCQLQ
ncbi:MAG: winged helix-turn-helix domain-containing protein [Bacteriovoracaceae bacterium]